MWLCHTAALNAWDRIQESGNRFESYIRIKLGQREHLSDFLQVLTKAVQIGVSESDARWILTESLAFENTNLESKKIFGSLKIRSAPIDEWLLHAMNIETFDYNTEA